MKFQRKRWKHLILDNMGDMMQIFLKKLLSIKITQIEILMDIIWRLMKMNKFRKLLCKVLKDKRKKWQIWRIFPRSCKEQIWWRNRFIEILMRKSNWSYMNRFKEMQGRTKDDLISYLNVWFKNNQFLVFLANSTGSLFTT